MIRIAALALVALALSAGVAPAQIIYVESRPRVVTCAPPPVYVSAPVVSYSAPVVYAAPVVTYSAYSAPVVTYSSPVVSSTPVVSYSYYPSTTGYSAYYPSATVYSAPVVVVPGVVTTRTYVGLGIFRPRGVYTETYVLPR